MKKSILKLNQFSKAELNARRQNALRGREGDICWCTCPQVCTCKSWDGIGIMPPPQFSMDMGTTSLHGYVKSEISVNYFINKKLI